MVFSSFEFLFIFLPISILLYYLCIKYVNIKTAIAWIFLASLIYYSYWNVANTLIIITSIIFNYAYGNLLSKRRSKPLFVLGLVANLASLGYYKYTDFAIGTFNYLFSSNIPLANILLPIGISFFTFQQIAYLSDIYTGKYENVDNGFLQYCCFVCFFPQLVAGPIVHHSEMMPQFNDAENHKVKWNNIYTGFVCLSIGLAKKIIIADRLSPLVGYCFDDVSSMTFCEASLGALAYTLQLYFDFSGYCDMAIGCALFFNINIPDNFLHPYRATNIQIFWQRWHVTLSRWLREYLYIPLGGNRCSKSRVYFNLFMTFLLGGLWHGAQWTFVLWGAMHGVALALHRFYSNHINIRTPMFLNWIITFVFVNLAWIVFRVPSFERLGVFVDGLLGKNGFFFDMYFAGKVKILLNDGFKNILLFVGFALILSLVKSKYFNRQELLSRPYLMTTICSALFFIVSIVIMLSGTQESEFIYFQF